ncbi:HI1506-related protein [Gluconacetobacter sp.]|uniref:HI1506-related protein n=1 Tax=Gluconacetobacter sp. TaxID=1935994 RepID=UPI0039EAEA12
MAETGKEESTVSILSAAGVRKVAPGSLIVVSRQPGQRRAGVAHPAEAVYADDHFTKEQLKLMRADPMLCLIEVG